MKGLLRRLTSRKFLLAVAAFASALAKNNITAASVVAAIYIGSQTYLDTLE